MIPAVPAGGVAVVTAVLLAIAVDNAGGWHRERGAGKPPAAPPEPSGAGSRPPGIAALGWRARMTAMILRAALLAVLGLTPLGAWFVRLVAPDDAVWRDVAAWLVILAAVAATRFPVSWWIRRARQMSPALASPALAGPREGLRLRLAVRGMVASVYLSIALFATAVLLDVRGDVGASLGASAALVGTSYLLKQAFRDAVRRLPRPERLAAVAASLPGQPEAAGGPGAAGGSGTEVAEGWLGVVSNAAVVSVRKRPVIVVAPPVAAALTDRQLRAVLAHEIAHVQHRDGSRRSRRTLLAISCAGAIAVTLYDVPGLRGLAGLSSHLTGPSMPFLLATGYLAFRFLSAVNLRAARAEERAADQRMVELTGDPEACHEAMAALMSPLGTPGSWTWPQRLLFATHPAAGERLGLLQSRGPADSTSPAGNGMTASGKH
jgi:Zn-dependent protease with chaperone function